MARYIDAEPLEKLAAAMINQYRQSGQEEYELPWHGKLLFIQNAPTADVAPVVHGRWKYRKRQNTATCTKCSFKRDLDIDFGRAVACPNCGAKMDAEEVT